MINANVKFKITFRRKTDKLQDFRKIKFLPSTWSIEKRVGKRKNPRWVSLKLKHFTNVPAEFQTGRRYFQTVYLTYV